MSFQHWRILSFIKTNRLLSGFYAILLLLLLLTRFYCFRPYIDNPHEWRQCDTLGITNNFYLHGISLFHPEVCWMGNRGRVIMEFPLQEAITAGLYQILHPTILLDRLTTVAFFLLAAFYFFKIFQAIADTRFAFNVTCVYMCIPLGIYYSRCPHIDFCAIFFGNAMCYYYLRGFQENRTNLIALASVLCLFGFLVKIPYLFFFVLPLGFMALRTVPLKRLLLWLPIMIAPLFVFMLWRRYVDATNSAMPDWDFIPHYSKLVGPGVDQWYYGTLAQREDPKNWITIARTAYQQVGMNKVAFLGMFGLLVLPVSRPARIFCWLWILGVLFYVSVFFNLNLVHNYYQLPLMMPAAIGLGGLVTWGTRVQWTEWLPGLRLPQRFNSLSRVASYVLLAGICGYGFYLVTKFYYQVDRVRLELGQVVEAHTPESALVVASINETAYCDPTLLALSRRNGWAISVADLTVPLIERFQAEGAKYFAVAYMNEIPDPARPVLSHWPSVETHDMLLPGWKVALARLDN